MSALGTAPGGVAAAWAGPRPAGPTGRTASDAAAERTLERQALMGTWVDLVVEHPSPTVRRQALDAAWAEMLRLSEMMSRYRSASQVSRLAAQAGGAAQPVAPELMAVLRQARRLHHSTQGRLDPTVGAYATWAFEPGRHQQASAADLARQQPLVDVSGLELDLVRGTARLRQPGMRLDLGGVAKLPILSAGLQAVQAQGVRRALINGGGDVLCCSRPGDAPWRIGLRHPLQPERLAGAVSLAQGVVAASGDYERGFVHQGRRLHHVLDPRTGQPSQGLHGVALVAQTVDQVNGWGPALMLAGLATGRRWLAPGGPLHTVQALLADDTGLHTTPGLGLLPV
ncbi:FAD:protein FMN transferase [Ideonella livida]|uniref:FAD:protein FMN transferase n=1 Tax=Ideonella livida TaxID=2707176 RepID=A0A7C9PJP2_9BURK|nr:FAD:protein FMN transferase [Ideonella livida]NDY93588.1 FAD:protein FMN transferase [Ideonella livida]